MIDGRKCVKIILVLDWSDRFAESKSAPLIVGLTLIHRTDSDLCRLTCPCPLPQGTIRRGGAVAGRPQCLRDLVQPETERQFCHNVLSTGVAMSTGKFASTSSSIARSASHNDKDLFIVFNNTGFLYTSLHANCLSAFLNSCPFFSRDLAVVLSCWEPFDMQ